MAIHRGYEPGSLGQTHYLYAVIVDEPEGDEALFYSLIDLPDGSRLRVPYVTPVSSHAAALLANATLIQPDVALRVATFIQEGPVER
jgi:hypothetical protein